MNLLRLQTTQGGRLSRRPVVGATTLTLAGGRALWQLWATRNADGMAEGRLRFWFLLVVAW